MKKLLLLFFLLGSTQVSFSQIQFNPQFGLSFLNLSDDSQTPKGTNLTVDADFSADVGVMAGFDVRFGNRFNFQPGLFFARNVTITKFKGDTLLIPEEYENKIVRSSLKIKALASYNLVHKDGFKLRLSAGPTYDFILSVDNNKEEIDFDESDFKGGSFNLDAGLGVDIWFLTAEMGYSYGLTEAFENNSEINFSSKYNTFYLTLGVVFGKGMK